MHEPGTLLLDEPLGKLDAMTRERIRADLQDMWMRRRPTVVFVTHSIAEAIFLSDRVIVLSSRPGETREVVPIDLPRPREIGIDEDPRFGRLLNHIRGLLEGTQQTARRPNRWAVLTGSSGQRTMAGE